MALNRRAALIERMAAEASRNDRRVSSTCFEILCGLPLGTQSDAAVAAMRRFLPHFARMRPHVDGPRRLLDDPAAWVARHRRATPLVDDPEPLAESSFGSAFDGLLLAHAFPDDAYAVTSGCTYAIAAAVAAHADLAWMADLPGVESSVASGATDRPRPDPSTNAAYRAAEAREWSRVGDWLRRPEVIDAPDPCSPSEIAAMVARWVEHEEIIVVPGLRPHAPDPHPIDWAAVDARVEARLAAGDAATPDQILAEEIAREQTRPRD